MPWVYFMIEVHPVLICYIITQIVRLRRALHDKAAKDKYLLGFVKICEPLLIIAIVSSLKILVSNAFPCVQPQCIFPDSR